MKKTLSLIMLLWVVTLAACSADEPQTISATEDYNREFVKEFGVPAAGHDFSMATSAGLKVTSANGDHITVTAEIDGEEYLFADCHVPAGTTAIPVTIPRTVSELKLATPRGERTVATNALVNLDEIKTQEITRAVAQNEVNQPWIAFYASALTHKFLDYDIKGVKFNKVVNRYFQRRPFTGYIFPIYWRRDKNGNKDYKVRFVTSALGHNSFVNSTDIIFDENQCAANPFPAIRYNMTSIANLTSNSNFYGGGQESDESAYHTAFGFTVVSKGIRVEDYMTEDLQKGSTDLYLEVDYGFDAAGNYSTSSESPYRNLVHWNGNYFDVPLKDLNRAYYCTWSLDLDQDFYIYDEKLEEGTPEGNFKKINRHAELIGFSTAPTSHAAMNPFDYCDLIFLYIPTSSFRSGASMYSKQPPFTWTIAAEDLGATDDWDFNDVVFNFTDQIKDLNTENINATRGFPATDQCGPRDAEPVRVITVTPKAAGGTMPLYITYTGKIAKVPAIPDGGSETADVMYSTANEAIKELTASLDNMSEGTYIIGKEIHSWLGAESYKTMINTGDKNQNIKTQSVEFAIPVDTQLGVGYDSASGSFDNSSLMASVANKSLCGFAVLVDRDNALGIDALNDAEQGMHRADNLVLGNGTYVIGRPDPANGEIAPQMILVNNGYWKWPQERVKISEAYPDFAAWLANPSSVADWAKNYVKEKVTY